MSLTITLAGTYLQRHSPELRLYSRKVIWWYARKYW